MESFTVEAVDPNEKVGPTGVGEARYISGKQPLSYKILFENIAEATAPAQEVIITDTFNVEKMDMNTFTFGLISFGNKLLTPATGLTEFTTEVDLRPDNDLIVEIKGHLDTNSGKLTWRFTSLDPVTRKPISDDPDRRLDGFLPPNVEPSEGEGGVLYTISPKAGLPTGNELRNQASIVFDPKFGGPTIDTPEWFNTIDNMKPESQVLSLTSFQNSNSFNVEWSGTDVGSGVSDYTIFFSEDGVRFKVWLRYTPVTSAVFTGEAGKTYSFYSLVRDKTGNLEDAPDDPDSTTTVLANQPPVAICQDVTVPAKPGLCSADASVDDGSYDPNGDTITFFQEPAGPYSLGDTDVTLTVTDEKGASDTCETTVTVEDQEAPIITSVTANPNKLWPPNHKMVPVVVAIDATDNCDSVCQIISVESNEPVNGLGDGNTAPDWVITGDLTLKLRAERSGTGSGRIYTITVECADSSGNSSTDTATVTVPHDKRGKKNNKK